MCGVTFCSFSLFFFFFSSRRRHTRFDCDWSSDVCSSDLASGSEGLGRFPVPNLVSLVGAQKTETFLRGALQAENIQLEFEGQNETARLSQKLALEMIDQLKKPQWSLVNSLDTVELYEAMD